MSTLRAKLEDRNHALVIAEIAQGHDGSLGTCHAYVDALADAGVDAIKFQTHIADEESTLDEQFRVKFSYQDETRYDYWRRMEFTEAQWTELKAHAEARGLGFLSTPFSVAAVEMLERLGVEAWKVGSGDTMAEGILGAILATRKPVIVSTGMSPWSEIDALVATLSGSRVAFALMQCTSKYPTPIREVGFNNLAEMSSRYGCRVGISDHSGSTTPSIAAIARGFGLIEVHATFDRRMFGPDVTSSLTIEQIACITRFSAELRAMDDNPVDKDSMAAELGHNKAIFGRSVACRTNLPFGHVLRAEDLVAKKPGGGIAWSDAGSLVGRRLCRGVASNRLLRVEDLE